MRLNDHDNTSADYRRARALRRDASPVERKLWAVLKMSAAARDLRFRRQHVVHPYIADFACLRARLLVEIDGTSHDGRQGYDAAREEFLRDAGYRVVRFANDEVMRNVEGVVMAILDLAEKLAQTTESCAQLHAPHPNPPRKGEGAAAAHERTDYEKNHA